MLLLLLSSPSEHSHDVADHLLSDEGVGGGAHHGGGAGRSTALAAARGAEAATEVPQLEEGGKCNGFLFVCAFVKQSFKGKMPGFF